MLVYLRKNERRFHKQPHGDYLKTVDRDNRTILSVETFLEMNVNKTNTVLPVFLFEKKVLCS